MKEKVESTLEPVEGEQVLYVAHPSMFRNHPLWFIGLVLLCLIGFALPFIPFIETSGITKAVEILVPMIIGLTCFGLWWLQCKGTTVTVTSERTSCRRGILSKSITEVWHQDIRNVQLNQSLLQRILDVGKIGISSAGQSGLEISVSGIPNPDKIKQLIDQHRRRD
jgi:uncharacterized membrane protein YdbT with pleckstrin-like domain